MLNSPLGWATRAGTCPRAGQGHIPKLDRDMSPPLPGRVEAPAPSHHAWAISAAPGGAIATPDELRQLLNQSCFMPLLSPVASKHQETQKVALNHCYPSFFLLILSRADPS